MKKLTKLPVATGIVLFAVCSGSALAHTQSGVLGNTTSSGTKTDKYVVECSGGTHHLQIQVRDKKTAPELGTKLTISAVNGTAAACTASSTDNTDTDGLYSAIASCDGGDGDYVMSVVKPAWTANGKETYIAQFHCEDAAGNHTETVFSQIQNQ